MNIHLILGTEQNCKVHIRASIYNKFKTYLFEKDKYKREYFKYSFPDIEVFDNIYTLIKEINFNEVSLITILLQKRYKKEIYKLLPRYKNFTLNSIPLTSDCLKKFNPNKSFLYIEEAYTLKQEIFNKRNFYDIKNIKINTKESPEFISQLKNSKYLDLTLLKSFWPLHLKYSLESPQIKILSFKNDKLFGVYLLEDKKINFSISFNNDNEDLIINNNKNDYSFSRYFINDKNLISNLKFYFYEMISLLTNKYPNNSLFILYSEIKDCIQNKKNTKNLDRCYLKNYIYLNQVNYD